MKKLALLSFVMCLFVASCEKNDSGLTKDGLPINCAPNEIVYKTQYGYPIELKEGYDDFGGAVLVANLCEKGYCKYVFDANITEIPDNAFSARVSLLSMVIPNSVTLIGDNAFYGCTSLTSITIPDSVTTIGDSAFSGCTLLTRVDISDLSAWCKISFGDSYANPLYYAEKLYLNGSELTDITIPSDITEIKDYAFRSCSSLTSVTILDSVTSIGEWAFSYCTSLTSVTIGNSVTSIGDDAFYCCYSLTSVYCKPTTPPTGGSGMFSYNANGYYSPIGCKIYVPRNSVSAYKSAEYWSKYASYIEGYDF